MYRVLLVEDNHDQAELIRVVLARGEPAFKVDVVEDAERCEMALAKQQYHALLLDYDLPGINGLELLQKLKARDLRAPALLVTGRGSEHVAAQAMKAGAADYVVKDSAYLKVLPRLIHAAIEKYRLQARLAASERRFHLLFQNAGDAIAIVSLPVLGISEVNSRLEKLTGMPREELVQRQLVELFPPSVHDSARALAKQTIAEGYRQDDSLSLQAKDGRLVPVDISATMVDVGDEKLLQVVIRDASEKQQLERQIRASKMRLQAAFDSIPDMISVQDKDLRIVLANRKFGEWASSRPEQLVGKKCYELNFRREAPCLGCPVQKTLETQRSDFLEIVYGGEILQVYSYPMFDEAGDLEYVIEYARVVTEQKRFEKQLIQSEKLATIGLLSSGVAHELRNPLNTIDTARYYLAGLPQLQEAEIKDKLEIIHKNVRRASNIINNLLEFSRYSDRERESVDVNKLLDSTLSLIAKELSAKDIKVARRYRDIPAAFFSLDGLKQVFLNLIVNAAQAMPAGGTLTISTARANDGNIHVDIADTGVGISKENMQHIFSPFFTTKAVGEGTGLGLYISHTIVERDGGQITVESEPGKATTFCVHLPVEGQTRPRGRGGEIEPEPQPVGQ